MIRSRTASSSISLVSTFALACAASGCAEDRFEILQTAECRPHPIEPAPVGYSATDSSGVVLAPIILLGSDADRFIEAFGEIRGEISDKLEHQIERVAALLAEAFPVVSALPKPVAIACDDGSSLIEWIADGRRFSVNLEIDSAKSGWHIVDVRGERLLSRTGSLETLTFEAARNFLMNS